MTNLYAPAYLAPKKSEEKSQKRHNNVMRLLVRRFVTAEQRKRDDFGITEDDVMEIRQDISTLRYELIDILHTNGMKTPHVDKADLSVAGKKGKMMERRILKDFQIGIVEGIVNEVVQGSKEVKDVFSSIAKAIGKKASGKNKKEDWNEKVRKSTVHRDPIGSTRASIIRKDRRSLKRHILETANQGLQMDTDVLVQYNPKLSDATKGTRVAYVKFMASTLKEGKAGVTIVDEKPKSSGDALAPKANFKSIIKTRIIGVPGAGDTPSHTATPPSTTTTVEIENKNIVRPRTPIIEDPNESRSPSPNPPSGAVPPVSTAQPSQPTLSPNSVTSVPKTDSPAPTTSTTVVDDKPQVKKDEKVSDETPKDDKAKDEKPKDDKSKDEKPKDDKSNEEKSKEVKSEKPPENKETLKPPEMAGRPVTPTGERGKSKTTGKTISGWL